MDLLAEKELLVSVLPMDNTEADKLCQKGDDLMAGETGTASNLVEGEALVLQNFEDSLDGIGISHHRTLRLLRLAPNG